MKRFASMIAVAAMLFAAIPARAQYYQIANQLPGLLSPALSGSFNYKGYVELSGVAGMGDNRANFISLSTSQGFRYSSWFFMGAGLGLEVAMAQKPGEGEWAGGAEPDYWGHGYSTTMAMVPVFSDFRFNIGNPASTSFYIDLKLGAAWLLGGDYLRLQIGSLSNATQFYFKPSIGLRIPVSKDNASRAFNIGITYQLLTSNDNWNYWDRSLTLNSFGATIGYEW